MKMGRFSSLIHIEVVVRNMKAKLKFANHGLAFPKRSWSLFQDFSMIFKISEENNKKL